MTFDATLAQGTAAEIGELIASRAISSAAVTKWYLDRIAADNQAGRGINAVRTIAPGALAQAEAADREIAAGKRRGPLHGVPFLLKDNILTADGMPASAGALALKDFKSAKEATLVGKLREAGAVLLGKTNLTEFADFVSEVMPSEFSGAGGVVHNPLGPRYDRGQGSSIGSAASVAARFAAFAIGSETQNSIQTPSVHSSVVGYKPTVGVVDGFGIVPLVPSQDSAGPITVSVSDAALVAAALGGVPAIPLIPKLEGVRIGVPRAYMADRIAEADPAQAAAFEQALASLAHAGAVIVDPCDLPSAQALHEVRSSVFRTEFKASLNRFLETFDFPCGIKSMADLIKWNEAHPEGIPYGQSLLLAANETEGLESPVYVQDRAKDIELSVAQGIAAAMRRDEVNALLCPMTPAAKCTGKAGAPVVAIPVGRDGAGKAFGVTVFAPPGQDRVLLEIAAGIEAAIGERIIPW